VFSEQLSTLEILGIVVVMAGVYIVKRQYSAKNTAAESEEAQARCAA
jgi:drug/metabolite transporter (DMT)-like permease